MTSGVATTDTGPAVPRWTIPSFRRTPGRYPLGTEAVNQNLLAQELASGLPVLSRHPRYWSFYTFVIKQFWDQKAPAPEQQRPGPLPAPARGRLRLCCAAVHPAWRC